MFSAKKSSIAYITSKNDHMLSTSARRFWPGSVASSASPTKKEIMGEEAARGELTGNHGN